MSRVSWRRCRQRAPSTSVSPTVRAERSKDDTTCPASRPWWHGWPVPANGPATEESTMTRFDQAMHLAAVCVALLVLAPPAMTQSRELAASPPAAAYKKAHRLGVQGNSQARAAVAAARTNA